MKKLEEYIVPWVRNSDPYRADHLDFAWDHPELIRMMSNENPLQPSRRVLEAVGNAAAHANLYPDSGQQLKKALAVRVGLHADNVVLGNGSTDLISLVIATVVSPGENVIIPAPTFSMYARRTRILGGVPVEIPLAETNYWDIDRILAAVDESTKLVFLCSPNNPTGNLIAKRDVERILELGIPTFFDEAYFELTLNETTWAPRVLEFPHLMVSRTFSKAYGLAGLRLGYLFCAQSLANFLNRVKNPWNVSLLAYHAGLAALEDEDARMERRDLIIGGREWLIDQVNRLPLIRAFESEGNYVLIDASSLGCSSSALVASLVERGVLIRPMDSHGMENGYVRVTVGTPEENGTFIARFKDVVAQLSRPQS